MPVFESLVKECMEEANIGPDVVRKYARAAGSISYFFRSVRWFHSDCTIWLIILFRNLERLKVGFNLRSSEYPLFLHLFGLSSSIDMFTISSSPRALTLPLLHLGRWTEKLNPLRFVEAIFSHYFLFVDVIMGQLTSHDQLLKQLRSGLFKPNCGLGEYATLGMSFFKSY